MAEKKNQTAISDEQIIAALLNSGSISQAAAQTGLSARAIYDRMGYREFKAAYSAAKADIVRQAVLSLNRNLSAAVDVVMEIMSDEENPAATRLQAAKMIIENAGKFADRLSAADKYTADQAQSPLDMDINKW